VRDGDFVGVVAPSSYAAKKALMLVDGVARWEARPHPASAGLAAYLRAHTREAVPENPYAAAGSKSLAATYYIPYVQHVPLEPRAAVAEWGEDGRLTVWTATQNPFGVRRELAGAFHVPEEKVRVIVPDFGGAYGGKHTGECAVEAARLARRAGRPVSLQWTRQEEFTWASFRPAAVMDVAATLDDSGGIAGWYFVNLNAGASGVETPYKVGRSTSKYVACDAPMRHGSYRALAATANNFARESFMDELANVAGKDPLEFRLAHLRTRGCGRCWNWRRSSSTGKGSVTTGSGRGGGSGLRARRRRGRSWRRVRR
jgi:isoquinoline 1-oxidoreductase